MLFNSTKDRKRLKKALELVDLYTAESRYLSYRQDTIIDYHAAQLEIRRRMVKEVGQIFEMKLNSSEVANLCNPKDILVLEHRDKEAALTEAIGYEAFHYVRTTKEKEKSFWGLLSAANKDQLRRGRY